MKNLKRAAALAGVVMSVFLLTAVHAFAYIDPSVLTYIIQVGAAAVIAAGAFVGIYWKKIKMFFKKRSNKGKQATIDLSMTEGEQPGADTAGNTTGTGTPGTQPGQGE